MEFSLALGTEDAVSPRNIVSWDEFAVLLGKKTIKGAKVCTTPTANKKLRLQKKALKNPAKGSGFQAKNSMAKLTITLAIIPTGEILAAVYAVREKDFENKKGDPWKFKASSMEVATTHHTPHTPSSPPLLF